MVTIGVLIGLIGLLADLIASVRRLLEDALYRVKKMELQMERERGEREQLLANILNFNEPATPTGGVEPDGGEQAPHPATAARRPDPSDWD